MGRAEPSVRRRAPAAAGSDADAVVKVILNDCASQVTSVEAKDARRPRVDERRTAHPSHLRTAFPQMRSTRHLDERLSRVAIISQLIDGSSCSGADQECGAAAAVTRTAVRERATAAGQEPDGHVGTCRAFDLPTRLAADDCARRSSPWGHPSPASPTCAGYMNRSVR